MGQHKDREITQPFLLWAKQTEVGLINLVYQQSMQNRIMRNKTES